MNPTLLAHRVARFVGVLAMTAFAASCSSKGEAASAGPKVLTSSKTALVQRPAADDIVELVLIGDTGHPGPIVDRWRKAIAAEPGKDAIVVLGDLVYPLVPECPTGKPDAAAVSVFESHVRGTVGDLGAPTYLVIGNHDVSQDPKEPPRTPCLLDWVATSGKNLVLPAPVYTVDFGVAILAVVDTNALDAAGAAVVREAFAKHPGKKLLAGHHVYKTYHDKQRQDVVRPWMLKHGLTPDLYLNGHAHLLQFGVYPGVTGHAVPALTSGNGALPRERPACPPKCGKGQLWGVSTPGYAILRVGPRTFDVVFKDADGKELWRWSGAP